MHKDTENHDAINVVEAYCLREIAIYQAIQIFQNDPHWIVRGDNARNKLPCC